MIFMIENTFLYHFFIFVRIIMKLKNYKKVVLFNLSGHCDKEKQVTL